MAGAALTTGETRKHLPILDTHQHLWDPAAVKPPWLPDTGPLAGRHTAPEYASATLGLNVRESIYMEIDARVEDHDREADEVSQTIRSRAGVTRWAVIGGRPGSDGFARYIRRRATDRAVRGLRQVLHGADTPRGYCLTPAFVAGVRLLGELGLVFDVCLPGDFLDDAAALGRACPATRLVIDHCGNPGVQTLDLGPWKRRMDSIAALPNTYCKISGIVASARPGAWSSADLAPIVRHCAEAFGRERILFGSDWPVCTLVASPAQWVRALDEIVTDWPQADQARLYRANGRRAYGIRP